MRDECTATRIIGPAHDRTELGCELPAGHAGRHVQFEAWGRGSDVDLVWDRVRVDARLHQPQRPTPQRPTPPARTGLFNRDFGTVFMRGEFTSAFQTHGGQPERFGVFEVSIGGDVVCLPLRDVAVVTAPGHLS